MTIELDDITVPLKMESSGFVGNVKAAEKSMSGFSGTIGDFKNKFGALTNEVPGLGSALGLLTNPITLVSAGIGAFAKFASDAVTNTMEYNKQIRELTQTTGLGAEELSRIVQSADDWGIEIDTTSKALEMMNKKGITPSIDNIATLADEYVNSTDKARFMEEATKKYGKTIQELIPLLSKGGQAFRDQAASQDKSLLATDESIEASRNLEEQMDMLQDVFQSISLALGNELIPKLVLALGYINDLIETTTEINDVEAQYNDLVKRGIITKEQNLKVQKDLIKYGWDYTARLNVMRNAVYQANIQTGNLTTSQGKLGEKTDGLIGRTRDYSTTLTQEEVPAIEDVIAATRRQQDAYDNLFSPASTQNQESYLEGQNDLADQMAEVSNQMMILNSLDQLTPEQYEQLQTLKTEYDNLKEKYEDNADAHELAYHRMILDAIEYQLALDGLSPAELAYINGLEKQWGLVDESQQDAKKTAQEYVDYINAGGNIAQADLILQGVDGTWLAILQHEGYAITTLEDYKKALEDFSSKHHLINVDIVYNAGQMPIPGMPNPPNAYATGVDMIVPSGYNENYPIGYASSGERVIVVPKNEVNKGNGGGVSIDYKEMANALAPVIARAWRVEMEKV